MSHNNNLFVAAKYSNAASVLRSLVYEPLYGDNLVW